MNKPVCLGLSILEIIKTRMYEFLYEYLKPKYNENIRLCYTDNDSFIFMLKLKIFIKILLMMQKNGLIHQIGSVIDHCLKEKSDRIDERSIGRKDYDKICCS